LRLLVAQLLLLVSVASARFHIVAHLRIDEDALNSLFWRVSIPGTIEYLRHPILDDLSQLGASDADIEDARRFLLEHGAHTVSVDAVRHTLTAVFASAPTTWRNGVPPRHMLPPSIDMVHRRQAVEKFTHGVAEQPAVKAPDFGSYTISAQKKAYGIPTDLQATNSSTTQMVWGPGTFGYSQLQLRLLKLREVPLLDLDKVTFDTENHGQSGGDNYGEGNLDTQMISSFGLNANTIVSNTNASASTEEGDGFGPAMLDFLTSLAARPQLPHVLSLSLGSLSAYSCDLLCEKAAALGVTASDCSRYISEQRQVCMFPSKDVAHRIDVALQVLGVRGVTVFGSSGDGGSHFSFQPFGDSHQNAIASTLNKVACEYQLPVFPTGSPYIVSVGGTSWKNGDGSDPVSWHGTGGGFAWQFPQPDHQASAVAAYLNSTQGLPAASSFNRTGRAFPDISAVAVEGTSQSSPIMAGIFTLLMDHRLNAGLPPLGFVAPRLWKVAEMFPGEAFQDVTEGNTKYTSAGAFCDNGFPAAAGWDPVTGWGRPVWAGMVKHLGID